LLAHVFHNLHGLRSTTLRLFTVYGPRGRPDMTPYLFTRAISRGQKISLYDDGRPQRDFTYITDITDGILAAADADFDLEIINLGNSKPVMMSDFVRVIERLVGRKAKIISPPLPASEPPVTCADISKARRLLGYSPRTSVEEGMEEFIQWYRREVS
jgi:UDP-glucuronate 4-epimerase